MYLSLYCKGSKRLFKVLLWEGVGDRTELQYIDPTLMAISVVSFSFSWCSTGSPGAQLSAECWLSLPHLVTNGSPKLLGAPRAPSAGCGFPYHILSATSLDPNSLGAPRAPLAWRSFPYHISSILQLWLLVLTELNNSSTPTQSHTQSLEWHVWSSSSGNNCHAVHRSLSSSASVYECTMGFFCPISSAKSRLRDFFRLLAIGMCHFLPAHHFGMAFLPGSKVKIQQEVFIPFSRVLVQKST